jgi:hypothetical protein
MTTPARRALLIGMLSWAIPVHAQSGLSKGDITKLVQSGLSESIIIKDIHANGIAFEPSVDNLIELRKSQVPETIMEAIIGLRLSSPATKPETSYLETANRTFRGTPQIEAGRFYGALSARCNIPSP